MDRPQTAPVGRTRGGYVMGRGGLTRLGTIKNFGKQPNAVGKLFVVAVDKSKLSQRSVRLAAFLMNERDRDKVKMVTVMKSVAELPDCEAYLRDCADMLKQLGVRPHNILPGQVLKVEEGDTLAATLTKAASGGHLVIGAAGQRMEGEAQKKGKKVAEALGGTAYEALGRSKAPVILVKRNATPNLESKDMLAERREGKMGMMIVVCVDGSFLSQKSFDMAMRFVKPGDTVRVVHVHNSDAGMTNARTESMALVGNSAIANYYKDNCMRAEFSHDQVSFSFVPLPYKGGVTDTVLQYTEAQLADLIILGSVELTDPKSNHYLGSVSAAIAKRTQAHVLVAKNFA